MQPSHDKIAKACLDLTGNKIDAAVLMEELVRIGYFGHGDIDPVVDKINETPDNEEEKRAKRRAEIDIRQYEEARKEALLIQDGSEEDAQVLLDDYFLTDNEWWGKYGKANS